jgi:hypothetical protein
MQEAAKFQWPNCGAQYKVVRVEAAPAMLPDVERRRFLKGELLNLDYPWPDYLDDKSVSWLEAELRVIKPPGVCTENPIRAC